MILYILITIITQASTGKPESENGNRSLSPKRASWSQGFRAWTAETGDENTTVLVRDRMRCFAKKVLARIAPYTFILHTKMSIDPFSERVGPRITFLKASQVSSCSKRYREITTEPIAALTKK